MTDEEQQIRGFLNSRLSHTQAVYACGFRPSRWAPIGQRRSGIGSVWTAPDGSFVFLRPPFRKWYPRSLRKRLKAQMIHELGKIRWQQWQRGIWERKEQRR